MDKELYIKNVKERALQCLHWKPGSLEKIIHFWGDQIDTTGITALKDLFQRYEKEKGPLSLEALEDLLKNLGYDDIIAMMYFSYPRASSPQNSSSNTGMASGVPVGLGNTVNVGPPTVVTGRTNNAVAPSEATTNDIWSGNVWKVTQKLQKEKEVLEDRLLMWEQEFAKLQNENKVLEDRLLMSEQEFAKLQKENKVLEDTLLMREQELEEEKAVSFQFRSQTRYLREQLAAKEVQLTDLQETLKREKNDRKVLEERLREAYMQVSQGSLELRNLREALQEKAMYLEQKLDLETIRHRSTKKELTEERSNAKEREQQLLTNFQIEAEQIVAEYKQQLENNRKQDREHLEHRFRQVEAEALQIERVARENCARHQQPERRSWIIQPDEVQFGREIGRGALGTVFEGMFRGTRVAVKKLHDHIISDHSRGLFEREMDIGFRCRHKNVLQFMAATADRSPVIITERADYSLRHILQERRLELLDIACIAVDTAHGINYLHLNKPPIMHRDLHPGNVLIFERIATAKVSDLGTANFLRPVMTPNQGTPIYSAPETRNNQYSTKADVYSFGILLLEMCIRKLPNPEAIQEQVQLVTHDVLKKLIIDCIKVNPDDRPDMERVIHELTQLKAAVQATNPR